MTHKGLLSAIGIDDCHRIRRHTDTSKPCTCLPISINRCIPIKFLIKIWLSPWGEAWKLFSSLNQTLVEGFSHAKVIGCEITILRLYTNECELNFNCKSHFHFAYVLRTSAETSRCSISSSLVLLACYDKERSWGLRLMLFIYSLISPARSLV